MVRCFHHDARRFQVCGDAMRPRLRLLEHVPSADWLDHIMSSSGRSEPRAIVGVDSHKGFALHGRDIADRKEARRAYLRDNH